MHKGDSIFTSNNNNNNNNNNNHSQVFSSATTCLKRPQQLAFEHNKIPTTSQRTANPRLR
jgi:hypothetical protein